MTGLSSAIFSKCAAGTTLHTAIGGRLYDVDVPPGTEYPYVVFKGYSNIRKRNFTDKFQDMMIQFSVVSSKYLDSTEVDSISKAVEDLYDGASLTVTGFTCLHMRLENSTEPMPEEHATTDGTTQVLHNAMDFNVLLEVAP
jgi:hypothetical protein